jgi:hypothetical protein
MVAVVSAYADDFCRVYRCEEDRFVQWDGFDAARAQTFYVTVGVFGRRQQNSEDGIAACDGFDQAVVGFAVQLKFAVFHFLYLITSGWSGAMVFVGMFERSHKGAGSIVPVAL